MTSGTQEMAVFGALLLGLPLLLGLLVGRWWIVLLPAVFSGLWFFGLNEGWWGNGVGDAWQLAMILDAVAGALLAGFGVLLHKGMGFLRG